MFQRRMFDISEPLFHSWLSLKFAVIQSRGDDVRTIMAIPDQKTSKLLFFLLLFNVATVSMMFKLRNHLKREISTGHLGVILID